MNEPLRRMFNRDGIARGFARLLIVLCLLTPMGASSLGLGDITLRSTLNQPLDAEIGLTALGQTRVEDIVVKLAPAAAFENAGLDRSLLLTSLNFRVETGADGTPYIKVTTPDGVKEPFLDFLIEINWPNGRLLREYTLLLDPPVVIDEEPLPVEAPLAGAAPADMAESGMGGGATMAAAAMPDEDEASSAGAGAVAGPLSYGPVQRSDTLWSIAGGMQQAGSDAASVEQIMMALLAGNPEAFYNGNINELKAGYVLRVSDPALLTAMSRAAAAAEVRRQNEQWMDAKQARAGMAGSAPQGEVAAGEGAAATGDGGETGPRLRLSVPEATATGMALEGVAGEGAEDVAAGSEIDRLKAELAAALETSAASRQENSELRERLAALQAQIDSMQRLATLQDDTLAALQAGGGESAAGAEAPAGADAGAGGEAAKDTEAAKAAKPPKKVAAKPAPASEETWRGLLDDPKILAIAGTAGVALLGLIWLVVRRRRGAADLSDEIAGFQTAHDTHAEAPAWAAAVQTPADTTAHSAPAGTEVQAGSAAESGEGSLDLMHAEEDEIDVLAEADVYLAYRRFDKAEELLREAIRNEPGRHDLVLKLIEVHAASGNKSAFVTQAEAFKASLVGSADAMLWDKVVVMGRRVAPEHALFGGAALAAAGNPEPDLSALELDADITAELDRLAGHTESPLPDMDLSLDERALSESLGGEPGREGGASPVEDGQPSRTFGSASNVIDFESRTGLVPGGSDDAGGQTGTATGGSPGRDLDWLTGIGDDLGSLEDMVEAEDDFSNLISGEDEVGTKLDLAKAYIDMGDQESARNILSEVVQEGSQDQQREANDLMRQIG